MEQANQSKEFTPTEKLVNYWLQSSEGSKAERSAMLAQRAWALLSLCNLKETKSIADSLFGVVDIDELFVLIGRFSVTGIPTEFDLGDIIDFYEASEVPGLGDFT